MPTPTSMTAGQNLPAPRGRLSVWMEGLYDGAVPDLCALLLRADSKVGGDGDFVFFNQPTHASGCLNLDVADPLSPRLAMRPERVPADVERVAVAVASDDELGRRLLVRVQGEDGVALTFEPTGLHRTRAAVLAEIYRREGTWRVRAVGQGWASGLAGLATDHGVRLGGDATEGETIHSAKDASPGRAMSGSERDELALEVGRLREQRLTMTRELAALNRRVREARATLVKTDERALLQEVVAAAQQAAYAAAVHTRAQEAGCVHRRPQRTRFPTTPAPAPRPAQGHRTTTATKHAPPRRQPTPTSTSATGTHDA